MQISWQNALFWNLLPRNHLFIFTSLSLRFDKRTDLWREVGRKRVAPVCAYLHQDPSGSSIGKTPKCREAINSLTKTGVLKDESWPSTSWHIKGEIRMKTDSLALESSFWFFPFLFVCIFAADWSGPRQRSRSISSIDWQRAFGRAVFHALSSFLSQQLISGFPSHCHHEMMHNTPQWWKLDFFSPRFIHYINDKGINKKRIQWCWKPDRASDEEFGHKTAWQKHDNDCDSSMGCNGNVTCEQEYQLWQVSGDVRAALQLSWDRLRRMEPLPWTHASCRFAALFLRIYHEVLGTLDGWTVTHLSHL